MNRPLQKGTQVNRTEPARKPLLRRGSGGSGARSTSRASSAPGLARYSSPEISRQPSRVRERLGGGGTAVLRLAALLALAIVALLALGASSASAVTTRQLQSQITEADGVPFAEPTGLAVDSADDLWVTDPGNAVIDKFDLALA